MATAVESHEDVTRVVAGVDEVVGLQSGIGWIRCAERQSLGARVVHRSTSGRRLAYDEPGIPTRQPAGPENPARAGSNDNLIGIDWIDGETKTAGAWPLWIIGRL